MKEREGKWNNMRTMLSSSSTMIENTFNVPAVSDSQLLMPGSKDEIEY